MAPSMAFRKLKKLLCITMANPSNNKAEINTGQAEEKTATKTKADVGSIRVGVDKVDSLINLVGELVITQSMLSELGTDFDISKIG